VKHIFLSHLLLSAAIASADPVRAVDTTFKSFDVAAIVSIDDRELAYVDQAGNPARIDLDRLLKIQGVGVGDPDDPPSRDMIRLRDGQRVRGTLRDAEGDLLSVDSPHGTFSVRLGEVESIHDFDVVPDGRTDRTQDEIHLSNGDVFEGIIISVGSRMVTIQDNAGQPVEVPTDKIRIAYFAATSQVKPVRATCRLNFRDGSVLLARTFSIAANEARTTTAVYVTSDVAASVSPDAIDSIVLLDGPVRLLVNDRPTASNWQGYFSDTPSPVAAPTVRNAIVGGVLFADALQVRSRSSITYPVPAGMARFRTQFGLVDGSFLGHCVARLIVDGKVVFEKSIGPGPASDPVEVSVLSAKELRLEVDFGENYDVQDDFVWLDAAFVRE
jgi:hypothetical protein